MRLFLLLFTCGVSFAQQFTTTLGDAYPYTISAIATDRAGNTYVVGSRQLVPGGAVSLNTSTNLATGTDIFLSKLDPSGNLLFTKTFAGKGIDTGTAIALDPSGNIYIAGTTTSPDFPLSQALQTQGNANGTGFLMKLTNDGAAILYSTYFGGSLGTSSITGIATDAQGNLYVTGLTAAPDFAQVSGLPLASLMPVDASSVAANVFIAQIPPAGGRTLYTAEIAPPGNHFFAAFQNAPGVAADATGAVFLRYNDNSGTGFIARINPAGAGFAFPPHSFSGNIVGMAVDTIGDAYFASDSGYVAWLDSTGATVSTVSLPGGGLTKPKSIAAANGAVWVTGSTTSSTFPNANGWTTGTDFLLAINSSNSQLTYSALYPAFTIEQAVSADRLGLVHVAGTNTFVAAIDPAAAPAMSIFTFQNAFGGNVTARVSPGEVLAIYGPGIGPPTAVSATPAAGFFPTELAGVQVSVNGTNIPLLYVSANQINAVVPMGIAANETIPVRIKNGNEVSAPYPVRITSSSPRASSTVINQDGTINSTTNPAPGGSIVTLYVTGFQSSFAPLADGQLATAADNDACAPQPAGCSITAETIAFFHLGPLSIPAKVLYAGAAPGIVAGVSQFNIQLGSPTITAEFFLALNGTGIGSVMVGPPAAAQ